MTVEEALQILDTIPTISEQVDALEMAIMALENKKSTIEELEKIRAEFEEDRNILLNQTVAIRIMDNNISELKGKTNAE